MVFEERGKPECPEEKPFRATREEAQPTCFRVQELNLIFEWNNFLADVLSNLHNVLSFHYKVPNVISLLLFSVFARLLYLFIYIFIYFFIIFFFLVPRLIMSLRRKCTGK